MENETKTLKIMKATVETIREIVKVLTADEQQLLKDTIKHGYWGDASAEFVDGQIGDITCEMAEVYCTNDARKASNFKGRVVATMFRSIYSKLCSAHGNQCGVHLSHCNDWWNDGTGDVLFLRSDENAAWEEWADEPKNEESAADYVRRISSGESKQWLFQFTTEDGRFLGRVVISSAKMPTTQEAVEEFAKVAPSAAKFVGKNGAEIITDKEQCLGDIPVGSTVYSNISGGNLKVVKHHRNYVVVLHLDGPKANLYSHIDSQYPVVVKKLGDSKAPAKKIPGNNGFSVSFAEDRDGV